MHKSCSTFLMAFFTVSQSILLSNSILATESIYDDIPSVSYAFKPEMDNGNCHLSVALTFKGTPSGKTPVAFSDVWAGIDYKPQIRNIQVNNATMVSCNNGKLDQLITHEPNTEVTVRYEIHQQEGNPSDVHSAIIRPDLIHIPGYGLGAYPMYGQTIECLNDSVDFTLKWVVPETWHVMTSYGVGSKQKIRGSFLKLGHSLFIATKTNPYSLEICEKPVCFSFYGSFNLTSEELFEEARKIISLQRSFFNDNDFPCYLISLVEGNDPNSQGGVHLDNCIACYIPKDISKKDLYLLLSHENFHNWTGGKIKPFDISQGVAWWKEGFTEYYPRVLGLRSGDLSFQDFIDEVNQILRNYYLSPVLNEPNEKIKTDYWNNHDTKLLPYQRGFVFAIYLNNLIKKITSNQQSLDNVMWDLFDNGNFSMEIFKEIVARYVPKGIDFEIEHYIENGETIELSQIEELPLKTMNMHRYYLGFSEESFTEKKIIGLNHTSKAYEAGLREGDEIIECNVTRDPYQQASVIRKDGSTIVFYPESFEEIPVPQLDIDDSLIEQKIIDWFGGSNRKS